MTFLDPGKLKNRTFGRYRDRKRDEQGQRSCVVVPISLKSHDFSSKTVVWASFLDLFALLSGQPFIQTTFSKRTWSKKLVQTTVLEEKS